MDENQKNRIREIELEKLEWIRQRKKQILIKWGLIAPEIKEDIINVWKRRSEIRVLEKDLLKVEAKFYDILNGLHILHSYGRGYIPYLRAIEELVSLLHHVEANEDWVLKIRSEMDFVISETERMVKELEEELREQNLNLEIAKHRFTFLYQYITKYLKSDQRQRAFCLDENGVDDWLNSNLGQLDLEIEWPFAYLVIVGVKGWYRRIAIPRLGAHFRPPYHKWFKLPHGTNIGVKLIISPAVLNKENSHFKLIIQGEVKQD